MVFEKHITKGDRVYGPYLYKNIRLKDGRLKTLYIGKSPDFKVVSHSSRRVRFAFLSVLLVFIVISLMFFAKQSELTGRAVLDVNHQLQLTHNFRISKDTPLSSFAQVEYQGKAYAVPLLIQDIPGADYVVASLDIKDADISSGEAAGTYPLTIILFDKQANILDSYTEELTVGAIPPQKLQGNYVDVRLTDTVALPLEEYFSDISPLRYQTQSAGTVNARIKDGRLVLTLLEPYDEWTPTLISVTADNGKASSEVTFAVYYAPEKGKATIPLSPPEEKQEKPSPLKDKTPLLALAPEKNEEKLIRLNLENNIRKRQSNRNINVEALNLDSSGNAVIDVILESPSKEKKGFMQIRGILDTTALQDINYLERNDLVLGTSGEYPIVGVNSIAMEDATIVLPKLSDAPITGIAVCDDWDFEAEQCRGAWQKTSYAYEENATHIIFTVPHFTAYTLSYSLSASQNPAYFGYFVLSLGGGDFLNKTPAEMGLGLNNTLTKNCDIGQTEAQGCDNLAYEDTLYYDAAVGKSAGNTSLINNVSVGPLAFYETVRSYLRFHFNITTSGNNLTSLNLSYIGCLFDTVRDDYLGTVSQSSPPLHTYVYNYSDNTWFYIGNVTTKTVHIGGCDGVKANFSLNASYNLSHFVNASSNTTSFMVYDYEAVKSQPYSVVGDCTLVADEALCKRSVMYANYSTGSPSYRCKWCPGVSCYNDLTGLEICGAFDPMEQSPSHRFQANSTIFTDYINLTVTSDFTDTEGPVITLVSPENNSWTSSNNVTFQYIPNDVLSGIANCTLILDGANNETNSSIIEGVVNNITVSIANGTHTWAISCTDDSENSITTTSGTYILFTNLYPWLVLHNQVSTPTLQVELADIDNDNDYDLIEMNENANLSVYKNDGTGNFTWYWNSTNISGAYTMGVFDWENDGDLDIIVSNRSRLFIFQNNGSGTFILNRTNPLVGVIGFTATKYPPRMQYADFNNDGHTDIVLMNDTLFTYLYNATSRNFSLLSTTVLPSSASPLHYHDTADMDGDGFLDVVVLWDSAVVGIDGRSFKALIYRNLGNGTFVLNDSSAEFFCGPPFRLAEVNGDGKKDIICLKTDLVDYKLQLYLNNGTTYPEQPTSNTSAFSSSFLALDVGDYNNDGFYDALVGTGSGGRNYLFTLNATYNFTQAWNSTETPDTRDLAVADLDKDGDLDAVFGNYDGNTTIYLNTMANLSQHHSPLPPTAFTTFLGPLNVLNISWGNGSDTETGSSRLYYNIRVGTAPGSNDLVSGYYGTPLLGYARTRQNISIDFPDVMSTIYIFWSVQTIDSAFNVSEWSEEQRWPSNYGPEALNITLNSTYGTNYSFEDLHCVARLVDNDTDTMNVTVMWIREGYSIITSFNNSYANGTLFNATLGSGNTSIGETWHCSLQLYDGTEYSIWYNSSNLTIRNQIPDTPVVYINSTYGTNYTDEDLNCIAALYDTDNQSMNVSVQWYNNSVLWLSEDYNNSYTNSTLFNATLGYGNTSIGETWYCSIRTYDAWNYSIWGNSSNLTIRNRIPDTPIISINSTFGTNYTLENLTCTGAIYDPDNQSLDVSVRWYNNSVLWLSEDYNNNYGNGTLFNATLSYLNTSVGEIWYCSIQTNDSFDVSAWGNSSNLTILPGPWPILNYTSPTPANNSRQINNSVVINITFIERWPDTCTLEWNLFNNSNMTVNIINATDGYCNITMPTTDGVTYNYTVYMNNTANYYTALHYQNFTENTKPNITSLSIIPVPAYTDTNLTCSNITSDDEGDSILVRYKWFRNGTMLSGETSSSLGYTLFNKTHNITCEATPDDYYENGTAVNASIIISNKPPTFSGLIPNQSWTVGSPPSINLGSYFTDADGDSLTYTYSITGGSGITVSIVGSTATFIDGGAAGSITLYFTANDSTNITNSNTVTATATAGEEPPCFLAGTLILLPDGKTAPIETLQQGDVVLTYNPGESAYEEGTILRTFIHETDSYLVINGNIRTTSNHPFYRAAGNGYEWAEAGKLKIGDTLLNSLALPHGIFSLETVPEKVPVYNLEVSQNHNYFAEDVLVHNKGGGCVSNNTYCGDYGECINGQRVRYCQNECGGYWPEYVPCTPPCTPSWQCNPWGECINGQQSRLCTDILCNLPPREESQSCCVPQWSCGDYGACVGGQQSRLCSDTACSTPDRTETISCCVPSPYCSDWGLCSDGMQSRTCSDGCGSQHTESQSCNAFIEWLRPQQPDELSNPFVCRNISRTEIKRLDLKLLDIAKFRLPFGYEIIAGPFQFDCKEGDVVDTTIKVPYYFTDVKSLKCEGDDCTPYVAARVSEIICGNETQSVERQLEYVEEQVSQTSIVLVNQTMGEEENATNYTLTKSVAGMHLLEENASLAFIMDRPSVSIVKPANSQLAVVNIVSAYFDSSLLDQKPHTVKLTIPYPVLEDVDSDSLALYVYNPRGTDAPKENEEAQWVFLGGDIDKTAQTISVTLGDLNAYLPYYENSQLVFGVIGVRCIACRNPVFTKIYDPASRDAVIMVHGFGSSPATFNNLVNDFKLNDRPWQLWTLAYPGSKTIDENAIAFANQLEAHQKEYEHLFFVAHSMGGLVTQQALQYAYKQNKINPGSYTFVEKVRKVILLGTPNQGTPGIELYKNLYANLFFTRQNDVTLFDVNSVGMKELTEGRVIQKVPDVQYFVIAGTKPFSFDFLLFKVGTESLFEGKENDGIVSTLSARYVGDGEINSTCRDYWEVDVTHTELLVHPLSRRIIESILAAEISKTKEKIRIQQDQYYHLQSAPCSPDDVFVVIGKRILEQEAEDLTGCSCGNGFCGLGETVENCPQDCGRGLFTRQNLYRNVPYMVLLAFILILLLDAPFLYRKYVKQLKLEEIMKSPVTRVTIYGAVALTPLLGGLYILYSTLYARECTGLTIPLVILTAFIITGYVLFEYFFNYRYASLNLYANTVGKVAKRVFSFTTNALYLSYYISLFFRYLFRLPSPNPEEVLLKLRKRFDMVVQVIVALMIFLGAALFAGLALLLYFYDVCYFKNLIIIFVVFQIIIIFVNIMNRFIFSRLLPYGVKKGMEQKKQDIQEQHSPKRHVFKELFRKEHHDRHQQLIGKHTTEKGMFLGSLSSALAIIRHNQQQLEKDLLDAEKAGTAKEKEEADVLLAHSRKDIGQLEKLRKEGAKDSVIKEALKRVEADEGLEKAFVKKLKKEAAKSKKGRRRLFSMFRKDEKLITQDEKIVAKEIKELSEQKRMPQRSPPEAGPENVDGLNQRLRKMMEQQSKMLDSGIKSTAKQYDALRKNRRRMKPLLRKEERNFQDLTDGLLRLDSALQKKKEKQKESSPGKPTEAKEKKISLFNIFRKK